MPLTGLGTYKLKDKDLIKDAILLGYKLIDTAELYRTEEIVVSAIKECKKEDISVITKIAKYSIKTPGGIEKSFKERLEIFSELGPTFKIHSILLHHPTKNCLEDWNTLAELYLNALDKVESIGVSNYSVQDLELLKSGPYFNLVKYNQIEMSPFCYNKELVDYCIENGIEIIAHTSLTRTEKFSNDTVVNLAAHNCTTVANVLLSWAVQHNFIIVPKPTNKLQLFENFSHQKTLSAEDMEILDSLDEDFRLTKISY